MNVAQAKSLSLPDIMRKLGYEPTEIKKGGLEYWYRSPFREEQEASFHTSYLGGKWIWNDFGDSGGTVIDFIMRHEGFNEVGQALRYLENRFFHNPEKKKPIPEPSLFSFQQQGAKPPKSEIEHELEFIIAHEINNPLIYSYLKSRAIPKHIAEQYLKEVKYRNIKNGKEYFAFGMTNESGGYEIRAASDNYPFKSALIKRDISFVSGASSEKKKICLFEGMTDFLSYLVMMNDIVPSDDCIIMHSLSSFQRTVLRIRGRDYSSIYTYLDNNNSGREYTQKFVSEFGSHVEPQSYLIEPYEDLNEALQAYQVSFSSST